MARFARVVNITLLAVMVTQFVTGLIMLYGTWATWIFSLHRIAGWIFIALIPFKARIVDRALSHHRKEGVGGWIASFLSLLLAAIALVVAALSLAWMWRYGPYVGPLGQTIIAWHWILGLVMIPLFVWHVAVRWPSPQPSDFTDRRSVIGLLGLGAAGVAGWLLSVLFARARATEARPRRSVTGSRGFGSFTGNDFPITGEPTPGIDIAAWRLAIDGAVNRPLSLTYSDLLAREPAEVEATVDCTSGWYSVQTWQGIPLRRLLEEIELADEVTGVRLVSISGYNHVYPRAEARTMLLATHVTDEVLTRSHGYPMRAVVPGRRGWFWVKWLVRVEVLDGPLEVIGGTAYAPRQILRQF